MTLIKFLRQITFLLFLYSFNGNPLLYVYSHFILNECSDAIKMSYKIPKRLSFENMTLFPLDTSSDIRLFNGFTPSMINVIMNHTFKITDSNYSRNENDNAILHLIFAFSDDLGITPHLEDLVKIDFDEYKNKNGWTPYFYAAFNNSQKIKNGELYNTEFDYFGHSKSFYLKKK